MRGFAIAVALILLTVAVVAQPILLEINTNFVAHKLQPKSPFISNVFVPVPKSIGDFTILKSKAELENPMTLFHVPRTVEVDVVPIKVVHVKISKLKIPLLKSVGRRAEFSLKIPIVVGFSMSLPEVKILSKAVKFANLKKEFKMMKADDINITKRVNVKITWKEKKRMKSSLEILEMKRKVSAYSPLGGLETIGKYLEQNRYALWGNQEFIGMSMYTKAMSSWIAYDYLRSQLTNFSLSFNLGPFSPFFSVNNGNVDLNVRTRWGIAFGGTISSTKASVFSYIPISFENFRANVGGRYFLNAYPTTFYPRITISYNFGWVIPYAYYEGKGKMITAGWGIVGKHINLNVAVNGEIPLNVDFVGRYFSQFGVFSLGGKWSPNVQKGVIDFSSSPFGFEPMQFTTDTFLSFDTNGNYKFGLALNTYFKLFFSYIDLWAKSEFTGVKPAFSYGVEASF